ncbi:hypothetical protein POP15_210 [Pectobacterium phage POP15]|nr:hypothetical protein POP15_210 [Pectobacterium phage POP15]
MGFLIAAAFWVLVIIIPVVGLILVIYWSFEEAPGPLTAAFATFGYLLVVLPLYYVGLSYAAAALGG